MDDSPLQAGVHSRDIQFLSVLLTQSLFWRALWTALTLRGEGPAVHTHHFCTVNQLQDRREEWHSNQMEGHTSSHQERATPPHIRGRGHTSSHQREGPCLLTPERGSHLLTPEREATPPHIRGRGHTSSHQREGPCLLTPEREATPLHATTSPCSPGTLGSTECRGTHATHSPHTLAHCMKQTAQGREGGSRANTGTADLLQSTS